MPDLKDRRVVVASVVAGLAVLTGLGVAAVLTTAGARNEPQAAPDSQGGLIVQRGRDNEPKLDPKLPLRCFVGGQRVGDVPLSECAKRNGVTTGALDVGLDQSGALSAAGKDSATSLSPLPQPAKADIDADAAATPAPAASDACWRYSGDIWRKLPGPMALGACVQTLFAGRCLPDDAEPVFGRWGGKTLRLESGEVDVSDDNSDFRTLASQASDCSIPPISSAGQGL